MPPRIDYFERIARLASAGQSFATATVVGRRAPVSSHLGDRAVVFADGRMDGFVGGACAREIVRAQALDAIKVGAARVVSIRPDVEAGGGAAGERTVIKMSCASEGAVDVYIEPFVHARLLVVVGATPVAGALVRVARSLDYRVVQVVDRRERSDFEAEAAALGVTLTTLDALPELLQPRAGEEDRAAVVASQGHYDEEALEVILKYGLPYVALVASRTRGAVVRALLEEAGIPGVPELRNPAGLDLGAHTPQEVALSILAEIVQVRAGLAVNRDSHATPVVESSATATDPVCGMEVDVGTTRHTAVVDGATYYFCCAACRARFVKQPEDFVARTP